MTMNEPNVIVQIKASYSLTFKYKSLIVKNKWPYIPWKICWLQLVVNQDENTHRVKSSLISVELEETGLSEGEKI